MFKLNSKTALITGAASGIAEAIANALSAAGARAIVADFNSRDRERVAQACAANGQSAHFFSP
jgi:NAD(P)-dependent dehydrogenase (short-subunit alcohol dehydrogenase family)